MSEELTSQKDMTWGNTTPGFHVQQLRVALLLQPAQVVLPLVFAVAAASGCYSAAHLHLLLHLLLVLQRVVYLLTKHLFTAKANTEVN